MTLTGHNNKLSTVIIVHHNKKLAVQKYYPVLLYGQLHF